MSYFRTCPCCGSNLDPGEKCDCRKEEIREPKRILTWKELGRLLDQKERQKKKGA